jgi:Fe-S cluster assembly ATP-binding protein
MRKKKTVLKIINLEASINKQKIINDLNLEIKENELHILMGPNGSGKSTLCKILAGHPSYIVTKGSILFKNKNLLFLDPEIRSYEGLFLAFQSPLEIAGVSNYDFLRLAYNEKQKFLKKKEKDPIEFLSLLQTLLKKLKIKDEFISRNLNEGFSGGEKKKNEILQMLLLEPNLGILDEIDSGLDIDGIRMIASIINNKKMKDISFLLITHNPKILTYLKPSHIHIIINGKIVQSGNKNIINYIEEKGYQELYQKFFQ